MVRVPSIDWTHICSWPYEPPKTPCTILQLGRSSACSYALPTLKYDASFEPALPATAEIE